MATDTYRDPIFPAGSDCGRVYPERLRASTEAPTEAPTETHDILIRIQMTLEELLAEARHIRTALKAAQDTQDYAYVAGDRDENGETDIERARRLDDEAEAQDLEPDIDDEEPPDVEDDGRPTTARQAAWPWDRRWPRDGFPSRQRETKGRARVRPIVTDGP